MAETPKVEAVKLWTRKVDAQNRVRLGKEATGCLDWFKGNEECSIKCIGRIGPHGQLQVILENGDNPAWEKLRQSLRTVPAAPGEVNSSLIDLARYLASTWPISCNFEQDSKRYAMALPKELRDLGIVTGEGTFVVIFCTGKILEIWTADRWAKHMTKISSDLSHLTSIAFDDIEARGTALGPISENDA